MSVENDPIIGRQLGTYQVQSRLGEGGMARVYKAYHPRLRREVAIKVILSEIADREGFQARFEREAQVIASLQHPNIVSIYDFGEEGNLTYLVMQYVGGGILRDQLRSGRPLEPQYAVKYAIQMARALHHAHQRGIVHRDVKPANMLISGVDRNHLLLSDFGIAKLLGNGQDWTAAAEMPTRVSETNTSLTSVDQIIGTADYISPEQANSQPVDARTDVYALGVVLYQMLTGGVPFHSTTLRGLLFQHVYTPPPAIREKNPFVPEMLAQVTTKAMSKAPIERFQTAEAMAQALEMANVGATNMRGSQVWSSPAPMNYPPTFLQQYTGNNHQTQLAVSNVQSQRDSYATITAASGQNTSPSFYTTLTPTTSPSITGAPLTPNRTDAHKRRLPLSYILAAAVLIFSLVILGSHYLTNQPSNPSGPTSTNAATAFTDTFDSTNNQRWQIGSLNSGVVMADISNNQYLIKTALKYTSFPYPQAVGTLPANFTLSATMLEQTPHSTLLYGIAFRFSDQNNTVGCYALVIDNSGDYQILEFGHGHTIDSPLWQERYSGVSGPHKLQVKAQGSNYTFSVDNHTVSTGLSGDMLRNTDISDGSLALLVSGPDGNFVVTQVQLSIQ